jgi:putative intracellular protease/amidase
MENHQPRRRALIVLTSHDRLGDTEKSTGFYLSEVTHVFYPLVEAGFEVDFASPNGGAAPLDEASRKLDDPDNARFLGDPHLREQLQRTTPLAMAEPNRYDVVHFAGGHGVMWDFPSNPDVQRVAAQIYEQGGIVAAVCHGPAALVNVKLASGAFLVAGKQVAAFTNSEEQAVGLTKVVPFLLQSKLEERGARVSLAANWQSQAVVSERLVTGQNPQSAHAVARGIVELARTQARAR